ncbi:MAG: class I SAM-dependent methyltransferase [Nitrospira sp.]|nr:class I SAM-dependent methyltransferase [bacterium]MBL7049920.1 class I SAM-dependent methyltransferase [Nitrospira sp.]
MGSSSIQGELWGARAKDWAELQEPMGKPLWEDMLSVSAIEKGSKFLDAGCGSGGASFLASELGADISGIDASEALIKLARNRIPRGNFKIGDLESMPFNDNHFDLTFAANSIMFASDHGAAVRELARVTSPGGFIITAVWGHPEKCDMLDIFRAVINALPSPPTGPGPFALSGSGALETLYSAAGITVKGAGEIDCTFKYDNFPAMWKAQFSAGPIQGAVRAAGESSIRNAIESASSRFTDENGSISLTNRFRYVFGSKQ